jgi:polysaccharide export outer membrane protein
MLLLVTAAEAVAQNGYRIQRGDVIRVEVLEDQSLNRDALVLPDGRISLPLAGNIPAANRTLEQIQAEVVARLRPNFAADPTVFVGLAALAAPREPVEPARIRIFVVGEAASPGALELPPGSTVLQAFAAMGGFSRFAAIRRIQLRRVDAHGQERVVTIDYSAVERGATGFGTLRLADGDVIVVPQRRLFE